MFIPTKYGLAKANINVGEFLVYCPCCESNQWADVMVSSVYTHWWYIPFYPTDKDAFVCCAKCGLKRYDVPFNAKLITDFDEVKKQFKHPWYTYIGVGIISAPIVCWLIYLIYYLVN